MWLVLPAHAVVFAVSLAFGQLAGVEPGPLVLAVSALGVVLPLLLPARARVAGFVSGFAVAVGVGVIVGALDASSRERQQPIGDGELVLIATVIDGHRPALGVGDLLVAAEVVRDGAAARARVLIRDVDARIGLLAGDQIAVRVRIVRRTEGVHRWAFNAARFDYARGIDAVAACVEQPVRLARSLSWRRPIDAARQWSERVMIARLAQPSVGVVIALVTGTRQLLDDEVRDRFAATGASHVIAVSGMHLALLAALMFLGLEQLFRRTGIIVARTGARRAAVVCTLPMAWAYVVFTGSPASAVRAGVMATFVLGAIWLERRGAGLHALLASLWLVCLWRPSWVFDLGFALSVVATWALIAWANVRPPARSSDGDTRGVLASAFSLGRDSVVTSSWAGLATTPVLLSAFGATPIWSAMTNLIVVPSLAFVTPPAAMAALVLEALGTDGHGLLWPIVDWSTLWSLWLCDLTVEWFDDALHWGRPSPLGLLGWAAAAAVGPFAVRLGARWRALAATVIAALVLADVPAAWRGNGTMSIATIPVGQGDATLIVLPRGTSLLVDAGGNAHGSPTGRMFVVPWLRAVGIGRVDVVVATHADLDHVGGLIDAMAQLGPREVWLTTDAHAEAIVRLEQSAHEVGATVRSFRSDAQTVIDGVRIEVDVAESAELRADDNAASLVMRLCHGAVCALLTGDIDVAREAELVASHPVRAEFLKVAHHGSRTSSSDAFLDAVRPRVAAIHSGVGNRYGLPDEEVVERLRRRGAIVVSSERRAPAVFVSDGQSFWLSSRARALARDRQVW